MPLLTRRGRDIQLVLPRIFKQRHVEIAIERGCARVATGLQKPELAFASQTPWGGGGASAITVDAMSSAPTHGNAYLRAS